MKKGYKRLQFDFSNDAVERIEKLSELTEATSKAEVVRNALRFYEFSIKMLRDNYNLEFNKNGDKFTIPSGLLLGMKSEDIK